MNRLIGIETEYGLFVEGKEVTDLLTESAHVIRAYPGSWAGPWNYGYEDPRRDARGFRVAQLATNPEDDRIEAASPKTVPDAESRSDRVLVNGSRLYNDHGHPEYATPECSNLFDLVAHDKAGERIVLACARSREQELGSANNVQPALPSLSPVTTIQIYKNNTDFHGMSYGCHEDYLVRRELSFDSLVNGLIPFFVTRQIYAGAGKVGSETNASKGAVFQLSQRAEFFASEVSVDTLDRRPIMNSREEPHANPEKFRRLHVIVGDANMSEYAAALKIGTTCLVLSLLESGWTPLLQIKNPVEAIHQISRDASRRWELEIKGGESGAKRITAIDVQRLYLSEAKELLGGTGESIDWVLEEWQTVLDGLETDPWSLGDRLDWVAKEKLLQEYIDSEGIRWDDPILQSLDLEYHNVDPDRGLYYGLEQAGMMKRIVDEASIVRAMTRPPDDTRAFLRGLCVSRFRDTIQSVCWSHVQMKDGERRWTLDLNDLVDGDVPPVNRRAEMAVTLEEFVNAIRQGGLSCKSESKTV